MFPSALPARARRRRTTPGSRSRSAATTRCAFCIVPAVRGEEISRPFADIVAEVDELAADGRHRGHAARPERQQLRPRPPARRPPRRRRDGPRCARCSPTCSRPSAPSTASAGCASRRRTPRTCGPRRSRRWPRRRPCASSCTTRCSPAPTACSPAMHRGYTAARYLDRLAEARRVVPDLAVSTDIIVGFPGETDDDFARDARGRRRGPLRRRLHVHLLAAPRHRGGDDGRPLRRPGRGGGALRPAARRHRAQRARRQPAADRAHRGGPRRGAEQEGPGRPRRPHAAAPPRPLHRRRTRCGPAPTPTSRSPAAAPHHLTARFVEQTADARHRIRIPVAAG